jgi:hypothetical protein
VERLAVAVALVAVVAAVALVVSRRRGPDAPSQPKRWPVPAQLDRDDFGGRTTPWLAALFTSATCQSCARLEAIVAPLASSHVAVAVLPWQEHKALHDRYGIEAVPCFVLADEEGVVRYSVVGSDVTATDLWAGVAEARTPNPPELTGEVDPQEHPSPGSSGG